MKISSFLIMFAVIGLFVGVLATFYVGVGSNYSQNYNDTGMSYFQKYEELDDTAREINESITQVSQGGITDVVGGLLRSGYTVLKNTWTGFQMFTEIADEGVGEARLGASTQHFRTAIYLIGFLLFIFAIIAVLTGRGDV